ncbi:CheF family chemotaxis protein [Halovenus rubra]|uniref:CheF family chemotaxis protein n=2 Tax=Halovenus rubra TaxID=869890 RepID=A0ACC7E006_9EURY|nr:CheF family chemotaxis protein [Halovenus rubra]
MAANPISGLPTYVDTETGPQENGTEGSVSVTEQKIILSSSDGETTFPLSAVADIRVGHVPDILGPVPSEKVPVTIAFSSDSTLSVALIANQEAVAEKFALRLIKEILDGTTIRVKHPARVGDSDPKSSFEQGVVSVYPDRLHFDTGQDAQIETDNVRGFKQTRKTVQGAQKPLVAIDFVRDGTLFRSLLQAHDPQITSVLGRFLQYT